MALIGQAVSEEKIFENGGRRTDGRRTDDGRTDGRTTEHGYTISSPCEPDGSGELKMPYVISFCEHSLFMIFECLHAAYWVLSLFHTCMTATLLATKVEINEEKTDNLNRVMKLKLIVKTKMPSRRRRLCYEFKQVDTRAFLKSREHAPFVKIILKTR